MRTELLKIVVILLLTGSGDSRPQNRGDQVSVEEWKPIASPTVSPQLLQSDSRPESTNGQKTQERDFKDLQHMNQSLRTVATQLLNVSESKHVVVPIDDGNVTKDHVLPTKENNSGTNNTSHVGRPMNSKFGSYFESSHPGEAMALTEEELEREMSSTRLITAYKNRPTTTGGISTWILLNPPSTTIKPFENEGDANNKTTMPSPIVVTTINPPITAGKAATTTKTATSTTTTTTIKPTTKTISSTANSKVKQQKVTVLSPSITTPKPEKSTPSMKPLSINTTKSADKKVEVPPPTTVTKKIQTIRTTSNKPKVSTPKTSTTTTITPPSLSTTAQFVTKQKPTTTSPTPNRKVTPTYILKRNTTSSSKIEKVTFRPVQVISITKNQYESTDRPMFITKIKASVLTESQKTTASTTASPSTLASPALPITSVKPNVTGTTHVEGVPNNKIKSTGNKVHKVQHKQPIDRTKTKIEIEPIRVNAPVLTIEKLEKKPKPSGIEDVEGPIIDLKFDFNPELTKINQVEQSGTTIKSTAESTTTTNSSTPVKRRRKNSKRKKNKGRRRKPATTSTTVSTTSTTEIAMIEIPSSTKPFDDDVQESKIDPIESKIASTNSTKTKKKPTQVKPISTQIYNFLSREVMPSVGMMSLVGLGLGLASYFLYPFGGGITRRNYEVEPNYKYNMDEYGGNYGQTEEEVLSKILQGAASDDKPKENPDHNYYRYQHYEGAYDSAGQTTRRYTGSPVYKPVENTASPLKHRNTDFRYDAISATTVGNYHTIDQKQLGAEYVVGTDGVADRQFVVGNVPKDLNLITASNVDKPRTEHRTQNLDYLTPNGVYVNTQTSKNENEGYEEIEITPTAVAVEHGPRALRMKRDSVIQVIPSRKEIEEEEKEEDLSNEILDIIDSAIPHTEDKIETKKKEGSNLDAQQKKDQKPQETQNKVPVTQEPSTATITTTPNNDTTNNDYTIEALQVTSIKSDESTSPLITTTTDSLSSLPTKDETSTSTVKNDVKNPGTTTVDWLHEFNLTTKNPSTTENFNIFNFVRKVAEIKFRLGLTILKHASEGFARYLGHVQKRINGEE